MSQTDTLPPAHGSHFLLPTVPPATSITLQPDREGPFHVGTPVNLECTVTVDGTLVDTAVMAVFVWVNFPLNDTRITPSAAVLNGSIHLGVAGFGYLLPSDGGTYGCVAAFQPVQSLFVSPSTNSSQQYTLEVAGEPMQPVMV